MLGVSARASAKKEQLLREEDAQLLLLFVQADKEADKNMHIVLIVLFLLLWDKLCANWTIPWICFAMSISLFLPLSPSLSLHLFNLIYLL